MLTIKAEQREITGKKVSNLRKQGKIPAVVYGAGEKSALLQVIGKDFEKVFREAGESTLVELEIGPDRKSVLIHEIDFDIAVLGNLGEKLVAGGLKLPAGVKLVGGKEDVLVLVEAPKSEEELKAEEAAPSLETIEVVSKKKEKEEEAVEAIPKAKKAETPKEAKKEGK